MSSLASLTPPLNKPELYEEYTDYDKKSKRHGHDKDVVDSNNVRQVAGCLPIDPVNRRILLISSRKNENAWVIPKGGWETDETQKHAAQRETWEEAGVKGVVTKQLGVFKEYTNKKKHVKAHHWIFEMNIDRVEKKFPEKKKRERRWFSFEEALVVTSTHPHIQQAIFCSSLNPRNLTPLPPSPTPSEDIKPTATKQEKRKSIMKSFKKIFN